MTVLKRGVRIQLVVFAVLTVVALVVLGWYYLRLPTLAGVGTYSVGVDLPTSAGLYATANVTYRGTTIGRVAQVSPSKTGVRAELRIESRYQVPADASANVHSVSAVGEQYLDLVSDVTGGPYLRGGETITKVTVPQPIGPALDAVNSTLDALPQDKLAALLDETSTAVGGIGPDLQRLVDSTQAIGGDLAANVGAINDIIVNSGPLLESQVNSRDAIGRWARNVRDLAAQTEANDGALRDGLRDAAPTADQIDAVFTDVRDGLPQLLANTEIVFDILKRYNGSLEQALVFLPQGASIAQTVVAPFPRSAALSFRLGINSPPPCLTGFLPASQWRSPADTSTIPSPGKMYCKIPKEAQNVVRGARNYPCVDVPGKRAATVEECLSDQPYVPAGTNPWVGDPNQILTCPAPAARCDQPVQPGRVIPAPSIDNGMNPLPADRLPPPEAPRSDRLTPPGAGTVQCNGQQPNPCVYTPATAPGTGTYDVAGGEAIAPDGTRFAVTATAPTADAWKDMLAPVG